MQINSKHYNKLLLPTLMCGNMLEYFDFFIFAHFTFLLAPKFYPSVNPIQDAIVSGFFFAIGFLARPIGGYIFGYIADFQGRKKSLIISVLGMAVPTFCIGILPTYEQLGIFSPIILIFLRIIQGICVGGEFTNGGILLMESYGWNKAGQVAGLYNFGAGTGSLLAIICVSLCTKPGTPEWSWRIPFLASAFLGAFSYFLRKYVNESPIFDKYLKDNPAEKFNLFSKNYTMFFYKAFLIGAIAGIFVWIPLSYTSFYITKIVKISLHDAVKYTILAIITHNILTATFGYISDKIGWKKMIYFGIVFQLLFLYPSFTLLKMGHFVAFQLLMVIPAASVYAVVHPLSSYDVPPLMRGRVSGFAFSAGLSTFAGLTPIITQTITQVMGGNFLGVMFYIALVSIIILLLLNKIFKNDKITYNHKNQTVLYA